MCAATAGIKERNLQSNGPTYDDLDVGDALRHTQLQETNKLQSGQNNKLPQSHKNIKRKWGKN